MDSEKRGKRLSLLVWLGNLALLLLVLLLAYHYNLFTRAESPASPVAIKPVVMTDAASEEEELLQLPEVPLEPSVKPSLVLVLVGVGANKETLAVLNQIDYPLALGIIPGSAYARDYVALAKKRGWPVLAHIPMEPADAEQIDHPACLISDMKKDELDHELTKMMASLGRGQVHGLSNHLGDKLTANGRIMEIIAQFAKKKQLFILDNKNGGSSLFYKKAVAQQVRAYRRDLYLDGDGTAGTAETLTEQFQYAQVMALREERPIVVVAHDRANTIAFLKEVSTENIKCPVGELKIAE